MMTESRSYIVIRSNYLKSTFMIPGKSIYSRIYFLPILIFFFALIIRLINLTTVPNGFHMDEVANTYVGRFILLNGKDLYGNKWPVLYFNKFGDYPPVIPMYLSGLASFIFGVNAFASRFPAAFIGALIIFPLYHLFSKLFSRHIALIAGIVIAVLPWHVALSRSSAEGIIGLTVFVTGMDFLFTGIQTKKIVPFIFSGLCFASTYLLYPSFRIITPLVLVLIPLFCNYKHIRKIAIFFLLIFIGLTFWSHPQTGGAADLHKLRYS